MRAFTAARNLSAEKGLYWNKSWKYRYCTVDRLAWHGYYLAHMVTIWLTYRLSIVTVEGDGRRRQGGAVMGLPPGYIGNAASGNLEISDMC